MKLTLRILFLVVPLLGLTALVAHPAAAAPISPPSFLGPPIPSNATDVSCDQTGRGIICTYTITFSFGGSGFVNCGDFVINDSGTGVRRITRNYNLSGTLLEEVRHVDYTSTESNASQPTKTATRVGHFTVTLEYQNGMPSLETFDGLTTQIIAPGQGVVGLDAGRVVINPVTNDLIAASGRHDFIFPSAPGVARDTQRFCAALR
jgi:hypothetical protein